MQEYEKNKPLRFCIGLTSTEFQCRCSYQDCLYFTIDNALIDAYKRFRDAVNLPLIINSGYRCQMHNTDINGSPKSQHMLGRGIDISRKTLYHLSDEEIETLAFNAGFTMILFYDTFIHFDVRKQDLKGENVEIDKKVLKKQLLSIVTIKLENGELDVDLELDKAAEAMLNTLLKPILDKLVEKSSTSLDNTALALFWPEVVKEVGVQLQKVEEKVDAKIDEVIGKVNA